MRRFTLTPSASPVWRDFERFLLLLLALALALLATHADAQTSSLATETRVATPQETPFLLPCMAYVKGKLQPRNGTCVLYSSDDQKTITLRLLEGEQAKTALSGLKKEVQTLEDLRRTDKALLESHQRQVGFLKESLGSQTARALLLEKQLADERKQRVPPRMWTEHPALWFGIGAATAVAIVVVVLYAIK